MIFKGDMLDYKIELVSVKKLKPNPNNTRQHTDYDIKNLIKSIQRFGFKNPIIANKEGIVLCGNGRLQAITEMGLDKVPVHYTDMSEEDAKAFAIMDNRSAELSSWNNDFLLPQLKDLQLNDMLDLTGFTEFDLKELDKIITNDSKEEKQEPKQNTLKCPNCKKQLILNKDKLELYQEESKDVFEKLEDKKEIYYG